MKTPPFKATADHSCTMVSEAVQRALDKAAQRAARRAEADAGLGGEDDTPNYPNKKLNEALDNAKEASRQGTPHPSIK